MLKEPVTIDRKEFAVLKAKANAFDLLETAQPWPDVGSGPMVRITNPGKFARRVSVVRIMTEIRDAPPRW